MPGDKPLSVEEEKKRLRQEATRMRLERLRKGKNPITGTTKAKPENKKAPERDKTLIERIQDFFGASALKKAGG